MQDIIAPIELISPESVTDDNNRLMTNPIVLGDKRPAESRGHAESLKKITADVLQRHLFRGPLTRDDRCRVEIGKSYQGREDVLLFRELPVDSRSH